MTAIVAQPERLARGIFPDDLRGDLPDRKFSELVQFFPGLAAKGASSCFQPNVATSAYSSIARVKSPSASLNSA